MNLPAQRVTSNRSLRSRDKTGPDNISLMGKKYGRVKKERAQARAIDAELRDYIDR